MKEPLKREDFNDEEYEKCMNDRLYFYNKYVKPESEPPLSQAEYDKYVEKIEIMRNGGIMLKSRRKGNSLDAEIINAIVAPMQFFFYHKLEKLALSGRPPDTTDMNLLLYGKSDPDSVDFISPEIREKIFQASKGLLGEVVVFGSTSITGTGFKEIWDEANKDSPSLPNGLSEPIPEDSDDEDIVWITDSEGRKLWFSISEVEKIRQYPLTPNEAFKPEK